MVLTSHPGHCRGKGAGREVRGDGESKEGILGVGASHRAKEATPASSHLSPPRCSAKRLP